MTKLFKKMSDSEKKLERIEIRLSTKDAKTIRASAFMRNLTVADFIRRAALGRRADVGFEVEIVLALSDVVKSIRQLNAAFIAHGFPPPREELGGVLDAALAAMLGISK